MTPLRRGDGSRKRAPKVQRWIDLMAALLARHLPATFSELAPSIPAYCEPGQSEAARMRMFERDKDELRSFGVPIETVEIDDGARMAYRLARRDFYLPYLLLATTGGSRTGAKKVNRDGYKALAELSFEPDELDVIVGAAARVRSLGDPLLAEEARSAIRKLAIDLPVDVAAPADVPVAGSRASADPQVLAQLDDALVRRKVVEFDYWSIAGDRTDRRSAEPYGLFFLSAHWYMAARDRDRGEMRNFRVSRISRVSVNSAKAQTPDFDVPSDFVLREHARSRHAWELGDDELVDAVVDFRGEHGATAAAARLGSPVDGSATLRSFAVRRTHSFARWLMSFGGEAVPVAPEPVVDAYRTMVAATLRVYEARAAEGS
jgi:predicted DNA-binding transcriptional regulator YafY